MLYQTHAFDAKLDHNGCVRYIRLIFNGYCFVGDAVFCQCRICRFSLCAGSKDDVSGVPFSFRHIAFIELFLISTSIILKPRKTGARRKIPPRACACALFLFGRAGASAPRSAVVWVRPRPARRYALLSRSSRRASTALVDVQPVLRLVVDDGLRAVDDLGGDFLAAAGGHAVHETRRPSLASAITSGVTR